MGKGGGTHNWDFTVDQKRQVAPRCLCLHVDVVSVDFSSISDLEHKYCPCLLDGVVVHCIVNTPSILLRPP